MTEAFAFAAALRHSVLVVYLVASNGCAACCDEPLPIVEPVVPAPVLGEVVLGLVVVLPLPVPLVWA
ncbi:MAG TPA: hypothetical protein VEC60_03780, partial [Reyranella sp.]|nr:hypothetical protein [Reyranella sp.]